MSALHIPAPHDIPAFFLSSPSAARCTPPSTALAETAEPDAAFDGALGFLASAA